MRVLAPAVHDQNAIAELVELLLRVAGAERSPETELRVELRVNSADLDGPDGLSFNVGLTKAWISVDLSGLNISPGTRYGEPTKANEVAIKQKVASEQIVENQVGLELSGSLSAAGASAKAQGRVNSKAKDKTTVSTIASENAPHLRVKARGAMNWEVSEARNEQLDGTYLNDEVLCRVIGTKGANAQTIEILANAKQKDLVLRVTRNGSRIPFLSNNHEKMLKVVLAKALSASNSDYSGVITFSKSEAEIEK